MERVPITRIPIKLRKAIQREYCNCFNAPVLSIGGIPQLIMGDRLTMPDLAWYLETVSVSTPMYFSEYDSDKITACLNRQLPVTIKTNKVLPPYMIDQLSSVPHSALHISINFLDDSLRTSLESSPSEMEALREMMYVAKGKKVFLALQLEHFPHLSSKLDTFEIVDMVKNLVNHILLYFPSILDTDYRDMMKLWESLVDGSVSSFKSFYVPHVPSRSWELRNEYQQEFVSELQDFIKSKKISLEVMHLEEGSRIRHTQMGTSLALGIRPFIYAKVDGVFVKTDIEEEIPCSTCGKTKFL